MILLYHSCDEERIKGGKVLYFKESVKPLVAPLASSAASKLREPLTTMAGGPLDDSTIP